MSYLLDGLQILLVAAGSVAVLAFLLSNLRYRKLELLAKDEVNTRSVISPSALVIQLLAELRKTPWLVCRIHPQVGMNPEQVFALLQTQTREGDVHALVENGVVVSRIACPLDQARACGERWADSLRAAGLTQGSVMVWEPDLDPEALLTWILRGDNVMNGDGVRLSVSITEPEAASGEGHPATVDPVTGVFQEEAASRAMRRLLAERRRTRNEVSLLRVGFVEPVPDRDRDDAMSSLAEFLMGGCRESDLIGLSGDQEFVLCLEGGCEDSTRAGIRMVREAAAAGSSVACGLATLPDHGENPGKLFACAGWALAAARDSGEGLRVYEPKMEPGPAAREGATFLKEEF